MTWVLPSLFVLLVLLVAGAYWGAGVILHPPAMSQMLIFPEQFGLAYERIVFKTRDGLTLRGWFLPSASGEERTLLMCHGWGDNKGELLKMTHYLNSGAGFNLVYFDHRSHGESEGEFTTVGSLETIDFAAVMDWLRVEKPGQLARLGVFGFSMGAAVAAVAASAHPEVKAVVLESPFTDYKRIVGQWAWNRFLVPYFPVIMLTLLMLRLRVGRDEVDDYSPIRFIDRIAPRPLLVIGGAEDPLMRAADVRALYARAKEPKELWIVPGAAHGKCHDAAGGEYERRVAEFFKKHL